MSLPFEFENLTEEEMADRKKMYPGERSLMVDMVRAMPYRCLLPKSYVEFAEAIYNFEVRPNDIFMITYPKSGSTWTQEMIWQIANGVDLEAGKTNIFLRAPFLEISMLCGKAAAVPSLESDDPADKMKIFMNDSVGSTARMGDIRVIKTHLPLEMLPPKTLEVARVIAVARNAKDSVVSWFHHEQMMPVHGYQGEFDPFARMYMKGDVLYGDYWTHLRTLWKNKDHPNMCFIWYEDMVKDLRSVINEVTGFLKINLSEEKISSLLDHLSFKTMRNNDAVNMKPPKGSMPDEQRDKLNFIRKGKVGNWREYFGEELLKEFDAWVEKNNDLNIGFKFD